MGPHRNGDRARLQQESHSHWVPEPHISRQGSLPNSPTRTTLHVNSRFIPGRVSLDIARFSSRLCAHYVFCAVAMQPQSSSSHNAMLGVRIKHPRSTNFYDDDETPGSLPKRPRSDSSLCNSDNEVVSDSNHRTDDELQAEDHSNQESRRITDVETVLPSVRTDQEAIDEYEVSQSARLAEENQSDTLSRLSSRKWVRGKSSIYLDAFNLALDTVLEEEVHLFDDAEKTLFKYWSDLSYEAQYL
jgi:Fanconi-associated nuclease 1